MIGIKSIKTLARLLGLSKPELLSLAADVEPYVQRYMLVDPATPEKVREVLAVGGELRRCQVRLLRGMFSNCFAAGSWSHGGIRGRSIKTNATTHAGSTWVFTTDVSRFYPSIHHSHVYRFLVKSEGCSSDVARILTQLCTHDHHLALGLITSPMLADQLFRPVDRRLTELASSLGLVYTRYVDDISFSGHFDFARSGIPELVARVIEEHGFRVKRSKHRTGRADDPDIAITQLRIKRGGLDVRREYLARLVDTIRRMRDLGNGEAFEGEYVTRSQLEGRVHFVSWINAGQGRELWRLLKGFQWHVVEREADSRGLVASRTLMVKASPLPKSTPAAMPQTRPISACRLGR